MDLEMSLSDLITGKEGCKLQLDHILIEGESHSLLYETTADSLLGKTV